MKRLFLTAFFSLTFLPGLLPVQAAHRVANYAEAEKLAPADGYIILAYAEDWNRYVKKRGKALLASEAVSKAAPKATLMPVAIWEAPTDEQKKALAEQCGKLKLPAANSYPAFILYDSRGRHYATLCGQEVSRGKISAVAKRLEDTIMKGRQRFSLLEQAEASTSGKEKARLTFEAYQIDGLTGFGKGFNNHLAKMDPKDESGKVHAAAFNAYGFAYNLNSKTLEEALAEVEQKLADPAYTNRQKQRMCAAALGVLRRKAGPAEAEDMRRYARRMQEFDPETPEGKAAPFIMRNWISQLTYEEGWRPNTLPTSKKPIEVMGELPIDAAGTYSVQFNWKSGRKALVILSVELYDGKKKVAEDHHRGETGYKSSKNVYTLQVKKAVKDPHLFISVDMPNRDSSGTITIKKG